MNYLGSGEMLAGFFIVPGLPLHEPVIYINWHRLWCCMHTGVVCTCMKLLDLHIVVDNVSNGKCSVCFSVSCFRVNSYF